MAGNLLRWWLAPLTLKSVPLFVVSYLMAQYTAITLRAKQEVPSWTNRSTANKVFQWVLPWWHNSWGFVQGQQRPWYEQAAAIVLPNQYTGYRVAKQSGQGLSFSEGLAMVVSPVAGFWSNIMAAYQASRPDVGLPTMKPSLFAPRPFVWTATQAQWVSPTLLPPVWRQNAAVGTPVVLRQTRMVSYRPTSPVFTQLTPFKN